MAPLPFAAVTSWSTATATKLYDAVDRTTRCTGVASTPTRGNRIYCVPYHVFGKQILNNLNDIVDIVSGINANSFNDLVNVTRGSTPHRSWWQHLTSRSPSTRQLRGDTRRFAISTRSSTLGSSMGGKKNSAVGPRPSRTAPVTHHRASAVWCQQTATYYRITNFTTKQPTT